MYNNKRYVKFFFYNTIIVLMTILICFQSPLNIFSNSVSGTDSSVFRYIAYAMQYKQIPYVDTFDHKGPLLYWINYIGTIINFDHGIWIVEMIMLFCSILFSFKTALLFLTEKWALLTVMTVFSLTAEYFEGGNLTEEYALLFMTVSLYYFERYLLNRKIRDIHIFICGFCCGAVIMIRANMISLWLAFILVIVFQGIREKNYVLLKKQSLLFCIGLANAILPFAFYLIKNKAIYAFWDSYIIFNISYKNTMSDASSIVLARVNSFFHFFNQPLVYIAIFTFIYGIYLNKRLLQKRSTKNYLIIANFLSLFFTFLLMCISGRNYNHYGLVLIPILIVPISCALRIIIKDRKGDQISLLTIFFVFYIVTTVTYPNWVNIYNNIIEINKKDSDNNIYDESIEKIIEENCSEKDTISVFGNENYLYLMSKKMSSSKYSYQFPLLYIDNKIFEEYISDLENNNPKIVIIAPDISSDVFWVAALQEWLNKNDFYLLDDKQTVYLHKND